MKATTTRRALLKAAPVATALVALPCAATAQATDETEDDGQYTREEYEAARDRGEEIAYLSMARAWLDRWKALGGDFGLSYNRNLEPIGVHRGMIVALEYWKPTDKGREDLRPHTWLVEEKHHDGAVKALEGLLELIPDLRDAVRELGGQEALSRWAWQQEA